MHPHQFRAVIYRFNINIPPKQQLTLKKNGAPADEEEPSVPVPRHTASTTIIIERADYDMEAQDSSSNDGIEDDHFTYQKPMSPN